MNRRDFNRLLSLSGAVALGSGNTFSFLSPTQAANEENALEKNDIIPENWKLGISISGLTEYTQQEIDSIREAGFVCIEVSCGRLKEDDFTQNAMKKLKKQCERAGLEVWSVHVPFSGRENVAHLNEEARLRMLNIVTNYLKWGNELMDARTFVIHPSAEPIVNKDRPNAFAQSVKSLKVLHEKAKSMNSVLCMENIPRTCLANTSRETMELLAQIAPDMKMCYDSNHLLQETPEHFVDGIEKGRIFTTHISDYDWIDERHWLPFEGKTDWKLVIDALVRHGFTGPFLYECRRYRDGRTASYGEMAAIWQRILKEYREWQQKNV